MRTIIDELEPDDNEQVLRLLEYASGQDSVARNRLYQLSLTLARFSLEPQDVDFERDLTNVLFECIRLRSARGKGRAVARK